MQYTIVQDYLVPEFAVELYVGGVVNDGELEPDLVAQLVSQGVLVSDSPAATEADETPVEETAESSVEEEADETPVSRRGRRSDS